MSQKGPSTLRVLRCEHDDNGKLAYLVARNRGQEWRVSRANAIAAMRSGLYRFTVGEAQGRGTLLETDGHELFAVDSQGVDQLKVLCEQADLA